LNAAGKIRKDLGKTQREVSDGTNVTERTIQNLEKGRWIGSRNLVKLADYYSDISGELVTTDALLGREVKQ